MFLKPSVGCIWSENEPKSGRRTMAYGPYENDSRGGYLGIVRDLKDSKVKH